MSDSGPRQSASAPQGLIDLPYDSAVVLVPTYYWEGWVAGQRERDFVLDISGLRLVAGVYLRF